MQGYTPLPTRARDALTVLRSTIGERDTGLSQAAAYEALEAAGFERTELSNLIEILLLRGYIYQVNDQLFVT